MIHFANNELNTNIKYCLDRVDNKFYILELDGDKTKKYYAWSDVVELPLKFLDDNIRTEFYDMMYIYDIYTTILDQTSEFYDDPFPIQKDTYELLYRDYLIFLEKSWEFVFLSHENKTYENFK